MFSVGQSVRVKKGNHRGLRGDVTFQSGQYCFVQTTPKSEMIFSVDELEAIENVQQKKA